MKNKKTWIIITLILLMFSITLLFFLRDYAEQLYADSFHIYYLSGNSLASEVRSLDREKPIEEQLIRVIELMREPSNLIGNEPLLDENVHLLRLFIYENIAHINFSAEYDAIEHYREVLLRTALVRIFYGLGIDGIYIYSHGIPIVNNLGDELGLLTVSNTKLALVIESHPPIFTTEALTIYRQHNGWLLPETVFMQIDDTISREFQILEHILGDIQIIAVEIIEDIAYVDLEKELEDELLIYAVVNTLTNLEEINEVQFFLTGSSLPGSFFRNEDIILTEF